MAIEHVPPSWSNQDIVLFHGTTADDANAIVARGIDLRYAGRAKDFGPGFYTTTIERQAKRWANKVTERRKYANPRSRPALVSLVLSREHLARLQSLSFVDRDADAEDFWTFVEYCRGGATDHLRPGSMPAGAGYYDAVFGPVSDRWRERLAYWRADQISFHTPGAIAILNTTAVRSKIEL
jgi:hypothetical protein